METFNTNVISVNTIITGFKLAGLEAEYPEDLKQSEFGDKRKEGKRIYVPKLGEDRGGRIFQFGTFEDLQFAKHHYDNLTTLGFFSHTYSKGLFLLQMNSSMAHDEFEKYKEVMNELIKADDESLELYNNEKQSAEIEELVKKKIVNLVSSLPSQSNGETKVNGEESQVRNLAVQNNFCINCGSKLIENAKFCSNCGTPVAATDTTRMEDSRKIFMESNAKTNDITPSVEFELLGRTLSFSADVVEFNKLRSLFSNHASKSKTEFIAYYHSNVKSFDDLFDKAFPTFVESVKASLKFGVSVLMKYDVDYVDYNKMADLVAEDIDIQKYISPFMEAAEKIEEYAENLSSYRNLSRAGRGRWQGGGFGLGGAIKGALTAGVLNMGTGMIRGIGDSLTNAGDKAKITNMKKEIFIDNRTLTLLTEGVYECCFNVFYSVWQVLEDEDRIPQIEFETEKLNARANNLVAQYASDKSLYNKLIDVLCECIRNYPYSISYYSTLYSVAKDSKQAILKVVKYFGLEPEYREAIIDLDRSRLANIKSMPDDTMAKIDKKISELEQLKQDNSDMDISALRSSLTEKKNLLSRQMQQQASINTSLEQVERIRKPIDEAIRNNKLEYVWTEIGNGNSYAEYAMEKYYNNICHNCIEKYNVPEMMNLLGDVQNRAKSGNLYATYLMAKMEYDMFARDRRNSSKEKEAARVVIEVAGKGNTSAIAMQGFWGSHGYHNATESKSSAIALLDKAANRQQPTALAWLGSYYRTGEHGLSRNKDKAEMMLKLAAAYDHPYGKRELEKLNSGSTSSSSCFITTAVCDSLGRADDGYELTVFRSFRDKWLSNSEDGESLIKEYYRVAPVLVDNINAQADRDAIYKQIWDDYLKECLLAIENGLYQRCKEIYCGMVNDLKLRYLGAE